MMSALELPSEWVKVIIPLPGTRTERQKVIFSQISFIFSVCILSSVYLCMYMLRPNMQPDPLRSRLTELTTVCNTPARFEAGQ